MEIFQDHDVCITQPHKGGDTLCNLVCHITGMLLYLTGNGRFCSLSGGMLLLME